VSRGGRLHARLGNRAATGERNGVSLTTGEALERFASGAFGAARVPMATRHPRVKGNGPLVVASPAVVIEARVLATNHVFVADQSNPLAAGTYGLGWHGGRSDSR
jgi:hypothetical protein